MNFSPGLDYLSALAHVKAPVAVIDGAEDEEFYAEGYEPLLKPVKPDINGRDRSGCWPHWCNERAGDVGGGAPDFPKAVFEILHSALSEDSGFLPPMFGGFSTSLQKKARAYLRATLGLAGASKMKRH